MKKIFSLLVFNFFIFGFSSESLLASKGPTNIYYRIPQPSEEKQEIVRLKNINTQQTQQIQNLSNENRELHTQIENMQQQIRELRNERLNYQQQIQLLNTQKRVLCDQKIRLDAATNLEKRSCHIANEKHKLQLQELDKQKQALIGQNTVLQTRKLELERQIETLTNENLTKEQSLMNQNETLRNQNSDLEQQIETLVSDNSNMNKIIQELSSVKNELNTTKYSERQANEKLSNTQKSFQTLKEYSEKEIEKLKQEFRILAIAQQQMIQECKEDSQMNRMRFLFLQQLQVQRKWLLNCQSLREQIYKS